ncbi:GDSL-like Lipase/Acylhydrolase [Purpureocillium lilacinum]|uniref:GDSL-like Lipase/Acylhydrolase n=1 Tax=Purpureocillium lilacinum TaxID=33203 RepID=A0A179GVC7_PURLI|nr:GDSL-like Lipase/Acylhydrolase [Purpureocillium lilacinum]
MSRNAPLRILCFGDSLTQGFYSGGFGEHPYAIGMAARLRAAIPDRDICVDTSGVPGDVVLHEPFHERLKKACDFIQYDWVIMLGGTNDLAYYSETPLRILDALRAAWAIPMSRGIKVLALTVPESATRVRQVITARRELNKAILAHTEPNFYTMDLHDKIPYHSLSPEECERYWDDGLHLTDVGYDWMGGHIADAFLKLHKEEAAKAAKAPTPGQPRTPGQPLTPKRPAKSPRVDKKTFEEELGDPKNLNEGYVVVRKKDLD